MNNISKISHLTERIRLCLEKLRSLETNINQFKGVDLLKLYNESRNCFNSLNELLIVVPDSEYKQELEDLKAKFSDLVLDFEANLATIVDEGLESQMRYIDESYRDEHIDFQLSGYWNKTCKIGNYGVFR